MRRRYKPPPTRAQQVKFFCFVFSLVTVVLALVAASHLRALLGNLAVTRVSNMVGQIVTNAVSNALASGEIAYTDLITLEKGDSGSITALHSNMAEFNRLQSAVTQDVLTQLDQVADTNLDIPIGTLTGSALLVGRGPSITIRMQSVGSCSAHFENEFSQAGINQTTHRILLYVDVSVSILLPGFRTGTEVSSSFSVAETVIVGAVPDTYTYFDSGDPIEQNAYEYAINNG